MYTFNTLYGISDCFVFSFSFNSANLFHIKIHHFQAFYQSNIKDISIDYYEIKLVLYFFKLIEIKCTEIEIFKITNWSNIHKYCKLL